MAGLWLSNAAFLSSSVAGASNLDFSALPNVPIGRHDSITAAANTAAGVLGVSAQSIIDALATCSLWLNHRSCFTDTAGTTPATTGQAVASAKDWISNILATQSNTSPRPALADDGISFDGIDDFLQIADQPAVRLGGGKGIITLTNADNNRILAKNPATTPGLTGDSYFFSGGSLLSVAGCFETIGTLPINTDRLISGYWNGTVIRSWGNGTQATYVSPTNGTVVGGNADPTATQSETTAPLYIGRRLTNGFSGLFLTGKIKSIIYFTNQADRTRLEAFVNAYQ